jgi:hypothetical protein
MAAFWAVLYAQNGWYTPAPDSPELLVGYMRFHVALADAIEKKPALADAPRQVFGLSLAEFRTLASQFRRILTNLSESGRQVSRNHGGRTTDAEQSAASRFSLALQSIPGSSVTKIRQYMNGPFRASMRSQFIQGGSR